MSTTPSPKQAATKGKSKADAAAQQPDQMGAALSPWMQQQTVHLLQQRGHAWLLQGPSGLGQQALGMALARLGCASSPSLMAWAAATAPVATPLTYTPMPTCACLCQKRCCWRKAGL